jgi:Ca2+-binding RTX toxin-like protein
MILGAAGVPRDIAEARDYDAIFSQLEAAGITVFMPCTQYEEYPVSLSLGLESDFLPPPFGTGDPSIFEAMRAHGIKLSLSAEMLYDPAEPMPLPENDPLLALIDAAGLDLIYAIYAYDEPAIRNISVATSQALYEHIKSVNPLLQVLQIHGNPDLPASGLPAYFDEVIAHAQWADMVGFDLYPIGMVHGAVTPYSNGEIVPPGQVVQDFMTWLQTEVPQAQHVMVLQAFGMTDLYSPEMLATLDPQVVASLAPPTAQDLAEMLAATEGAAAVFWWGQSNIESGASSQLWADVLAETAQFAATFPGSDIIGTENADILTGTSLAERISGNAGDDEIHGGNGDDTLVGGAGADSMHGDAGNDTYYVDDAGDVIDESDGSGTDTVRTILASYSLASANVIGNVENLTGASALGQSLSGNALDNVITGSWGNDILAGGGGSDTLRGGAGNDTYVIDDLLAQIDEAGESGTDTVRTSMAVFDLAQLSILGQVENITGTLATGQHLTGNASDNVINGGIGNDTLAGGGGSDTLAGGQGNDVYLVTDWEIIDETGGSGTDEIRTDMASYDLKGSNLHGLIERLTGTLGSDQYFIGNALANIIETGAGNDTLDGDAGLDTLIGGMGDDHYIVAQGGDVIVELGGAGNDIVSSSTSYTLSANLETLLLTGNVANNGTGNADNNSIYGNSAANIINGAGGADIMAGGAGGDQYWVDNAGDVISETVADGLAIDTVRSTLNWTLADNIENLVLVGPSAITGVGNNLRNNILGNDAANLIDGGEGADTMQGGLGNDTYIVDNLSDQVLELVGGGTDTVYSYLANYALGANVENVSILAVGAANLLGNALNNTLISGSSNNIINGGTGIDTASFGNANGAVTVSLATTTMQNTVGSGSDTLNNIENLTGSSFNDTLTGNAVTNSLNGGAGADTMSGGGGSDIYYVNDAGDVVIEADANLGTGGADIVYTSISNYTMSANIEYARLLTVSGSTSLTGNNLNNILYAGLSNDVLNGAGGIDTVSYAYAAAAITVSLATTAAQSTLGSGTDTLIKIENINGSGYDDTLTGNATANTLNGGSGADRLTGGNGSDTYFVDNVGDLVIETNATAATGGVDFVYTYLSSYTLAANLENARILSSGTANLSGNGLNNILYAGAGNNVLNGGSGVDTVSYAFAARAVNVNLATAGTQATGGSATDTLIGIENLTGSNYNDVLKGNSGANQLDGGAGNDTLSGGLGIDTLIGGSGRDTFVFNTPLASANADIIQGFSTVDDTIHLENTGIFSALTTAGALTAGAFNTGLAATQADDRIIYNAASGTLLYDADGTGSIAAVRIATLTGVIGILTAADFVVI